jgi:catechol 2,3-dioxygenase-like lactoylglutathione lyase family enzyme
LKQHAQAGENMKTTRATHDAYAGGRKLPARGGWNDLPPGWLILWALLALTLVYPPARSQNLAGRDATDASAVAASPRLPTSPSASVERVESVGMTVSDMERAVEFYGRVLGFEKVSDVEVAGEEYERLQGLFGLRMRVVRLRLGEESIELTEYLAPEGRPLPVDSRSNDRWFQHFAVITSDMEKAYAWLRQNRVRHASTGPQTLPLWNKNAGGIKAFYFKDPDGHALEILEFPAGKGAEKWRRLRASGRLFLGIDHTAIVVSDTEASLKFYRDVLGLRVASESENYGPEQERLNNVRGARLRITALRAPEGGPGLEFLEYLAPRDGRPAPADKRPNDLIHWQTGLVTRNTRGAADRLRQGQYAFVSPGVTTLDTGVLGFRKGFLVADPDGHVMRVVEY